LPKLSSNIKGLTILEHGVDDQGNCRLSEIIVTDEDVS